MRKTAKLISLATAVPEHILHQEDVAAAAREMFGKRYEAFDRMAPVFLTAGIRKRHAARAIDWYSKPRGWKERTAAYLEVAQGLFVDAANKALDEARITAAEVDVVVTVSSTGIATPSLEARAAQAMGFRTNIQRVPVFGLGCAGGVSGFAIAARLAKAEPGTNVLLVVVELCTLAFRMDQLSKAGIVACALFGDGAAACVLRAGEGGIAEVEVAGEHTWPNTLDIMGWDLDGQGFEVIFAQAIPSFAEANMGPAVARILDRAQIRMDEVDRFVCHPGGTKVLAALERALKIPQGGLDHERAVLREYGNMSAPTVLFVLDRALRAGLPPRSVMTAMGPGFSASCVALKRAA
ncbi:3-oxoacyl-[acyl-carrier-protein] synthase III C-terminal domain-containing protein [Rhizomicrobium palustre]|uniref:3-oxoacyl-[acyl-carrier-protein] synthase III C-terminal domain-containing protein n=1 Tax=Rhizomicrobium palustre TaxID=189966 RepID=UPI0014216A4B